MFPNYTGETTSLETVYQDITRHDKDTTPAVVKKGKGTSVFSFLKDEWLIKILL